MAYNLVNEKYSSHVNEADIARLHARIIHQKVEELADEWIKQNRQSIVEQLDKAQIGKKVMENVGDTLTKTIIDSLTSSK